MGFVNRVTPLQDRAAMQAAKDLEERQLKPVKGGEPKKMGKLMKAASLALGLTSSYGTRGDISASPYEDAPYDFDRIIAAIDTDSYAKQGFSKYQELMWKEGFELVGQNPEAIDYVYERFYYMEQVMGTPVTEMFKSMTDQLCKFHNSVVAKVRNDKFRSVFPGRLRPLHPKGPIVGYDVLPIETIRVNRDERNRAKRYKQELEGYGAHGQPPSPSWDASEIIHLVQDCKPGYIFGTPFMTAVIEDIIALRTMEEDIQNLVHQELFPIVDVTVGTEEYPGDDDEVMAAAQEIADMRHDGALIHTERRKIEIIGSEGSALDATEYLNAAQQRVAMGLGLYPHHLGMTFAGGNRSMTEQLDTALYDRIKTYQRYVAQMITIFVINELLKEGGFDPSDPKDKCTFRFREIDTDTRIKKENQVVQLVSSNLIGISEGRLKIGETTELDESDTLAALQARLMPDTVLPGKDAKPAGAGGGKATPATPPTTVDTTPAAAKKDTQTPSSGGRANPKNNTRGIGNKTRPQNQHGRSLSPNVRHSGNMNWLEEVAELLKEVEEDSE